MTYSPATTTASLLLLVLATLTLTAAAATSTPPPSSPDGCSDSVIGISPCLPFISDPPNNLSTRPSSQCCDLFVASFNANEAICLCYLIRGSGNGLLGFPVNTTKLLSLSSLCPFPNSNTSLQFICAGPHKLPPLVGSKGPTISIPHNFDSSDNPLNSSHGQSSSKHVPPAAAPTTSQEINNNAHQFPPAASVIFFIIPFLCFLQPSFPVFSSGNRL